MKVYLVCSKATLTIFYFLLLLLVVIGNFGYASDNFGVIADFENLRCAYLRNLGVEEVSQPIDCADLCIPFEFADYSEKYNELQKQSGFDLNLYKGQTAQKFTYVYKNRYINLILIKGRIVGGDITEREYNGRVLPLTKESINEINKTG